LALQHRLQYLAITDHDTSNGVAEAQVAAAGTSLTVWPGIELATVQPNGETIDILGYLYDPGNAAMQARLATMRDARLNRAAGIVEKLGDLGVLVRLERVLEIAGEASVGRPHIARALLEAGHVANIKEAFDRYIDNDGPAYVTHYRLSLQAAFDMLHEAGGVAVLAHPVRVRNYEQRIAAWAAMGLDGLEVYYPDHTPDFTMRARVAARQHGLVMTGGSDFHHREGKVIRLGKQAIPADIIEPIMERAARYR
jgi:predicted metal-dependent phosphoesterase TrpH